LVDWANEAKADSTLAEEATPTLEDLARPELKCLQSEPQHFLQIALANLLKLNQMVEEVRPMLAQVKRDRTLSEASYLNPSLCRSLYSSQKWAINSCSLQLKINCWVKFYRNQQVNARRKCPLQK